MTVNGSRACQVKKLEVSVWMPESGQEKVNAEKPKAEMPNVRCKYEYVYVYKYESSDPQSPSSRSSQKENRCP